MANLIQLVYVSRAKFRPASGGGIEPEVGRILTQSRLNNARQQIGGALYYGNGCFFQCLEGEKTAIESLYQKIGQDPRHKNLKILLQRPVTERKFASWSMKYVAAREDVRRILEKRGFDTFDPYRFDAAMIDEVLGVFTKAVDPTKGITKVRTGILEGYSDQQIILATLTIILLLSLGVGIFWYVS